MSSVNSSIVKKTEAKPIPENLRLLREKDRQKVKGKFIFHEVPGGRMEFVFRAHKGDPIETYRLNDGEVCELPLGVAKHLNLNVWYPAYKYADDEAGRPTCKVSQKIRRCSFQSLEFMDIEGLSPVGSAISGVVEV